MDMTDGHRLWARPADARAGIDLIAGRQVIVGDEDADPRVARIVAIDEDGNLDLEMLDGSRKARAGRRVSAPPLPSVGPPRTSPGGVFERRIDEGRD